MGKDNSDGDSLDSLDAAIAKQFASDNVSTVNPNYKIYRFKIFLGIIDIFGWDTMLQTASAIHILFRENREC